MSTVLRELVSCRGSVLCLLWSMLFDFRALIVSDAESSSWFHSSGFFFIVSPGSNKSCGCGVLYRPSLSLSNSWCDSEGHFFQCLFSFSRFSCGLCLCTEAQLCNKYFYLDNLPVLALLIHIVLVGDCNTIFNRSLDRAGSPLDSTSHESIMALSRLFDANCCINIWRYLQPSSSSSCFSWVRPDGIFSSRIDIIGCPFPWVSSLLSCNIVACPFSDQCSVLFLFRIDVTDFVPPGLGLWKLNTSVLEEEV